MEDQTWTTKTSSTWRSKRSKSIWMFRAQQPMSWPIGATFRSADSVRISEFRATLFWRGSQNAHLFWTASGHREEVLRLWKREHMATVTSNGCPMEHGLGRSWTDIKRTARRTTFFNNKRKTMVSSRCLTKHWCTLRYHKHHRWRVWLLLLSSVRRLGKRKSL